MTMCDPDEHYNEALDNEWEECDFDFNDIDEDGYYRDSWDDEEE